MGATGQGKNKGLFSSQLYLKFSKIKEESAFVCFVLHKYFSV
jgi:hypothetical protein